MSDRAGHYSKLTKRKKRMLNKVNDGFKPFKKEQLLYPQNFKTYTL